MQSLLSSFLYVSASKGQVKACPHFTHKMVGIRIDCAEKVVSDEEAPKYPPVDSTSSVFGNDKATLFDTARADCGIWQFQSAGLLIVSVDGFLWISLLSKFAKFTLCRLIFQPSLWHFII
jgi:hypothetical protein